MPTPDPIALPELPEPYQGRVVATSRNTPSVRQGVEMGGYIKSPELFTADQMRAYGQACVDAAQSISAQPEQLASLEQRARELLAAEYRAAGMHEDAYPIACGGQLEWDTEAALRAITAALSAQPADWYERREAHVREMGYAGLAEALDDLESRRAAQPARAVDSPTRRKPLHEHRYL